MDVLLIAINNCRMAKITEKTRLKLGKRIKKLRSEKGFTQEELAHELKISRTHMGHIEQGRKSPSLEVLERIARTLRVKLSVLFENK